MELSKNDRVNLEGEYRSREPVISRNRHSEVSTTVQKMMDDNQSIAMIISKEA